MIAEPLMAVDLPVVEFVLVNHMELRVLPLNRGAGGMAFVTG